MLVKTSLLEPLLRRRILATLTGITLTLFFALLLLPSGWAQRRPPIDKELKAIDPIKVPELLPGDSCCGKKPPFKDIPNYSTSTYAGFTGQIAIATNYANANTGSSVVIWDLKNQGSATPGVQWTLPQTNFYSHPDWTRGNMGNVFGLTLDSAGNIFAASSTVYGFSNVGSSSVPPGGTPGNGDIYKINANNGSLTRFVGTAPGPTYISGNKLPNTGPGLGNIHFSCDFNLLYVSNFEDGKIYRINLLGTILSTWDHGQNLPNSSTGAAAIPDSATNGHTAPGRRVWAVQTVTFNGKPTLFYSVWYNDQGRQNNHPNEVWYIGLDNAGNFTGSATLAFTTPSFVTAYSNPVADISFNPAGNRMFVAERSMNNDMGFAAHNSRLLEYTLSGTTWLPTLVTKFRIGSWSSQNNADGGTDFDNGPNGRVWASGDYLTPQYVYGIQGLPSAGGTYLNSIEIDLNNAPGTGDKRWMGDVEIPCFQCDGGPPTPVITPPDVSCAKNGEYCVKQAQGVTYTWNVTGGTPATATGSCINITWGTTSPKAITVTATNAAGCTSTYRLLLNDCPPPVDPCCPPWNKDMLKDMLVYRGTSISAPYTLEFVPTTLFKNQMQAYLNYLHSINPAITKITIDWRLHNQGTGTLPAPPYGPQLPPTAYLTWTWNTTGIGNPVSVPATGFFVPPVYSATSMQVGTWYMVHTGIYLENGQKFFPDQCANVEVYFRVQFMSKNRNAPPTLEMSDDGRKILQRILVQTDDITPRNPSNR